MNSFRSVADGGQQLEKGGARTLLADLVDGWDVRPPQVGGALPTEGRVIWLPSEPVCICCLLDPASSAAIEGTDGESLAKGKKLRSEGHSSECITREPHCG